MGYSRNGHRIEYAKFVAEEIEPSQEFKVLDALIKQPDANPSDTVQQILSMTYDYLKDPKSFGSFGFFWPVANAFVELAQRTTPDQQRKLIAVWIELQNTTIPDPDSVTGEPLRHGEERIWNDLPLCGVTLCDEMQAYRPTRYPTEPEENFNLPEEEDRWERLSTFVAQLTGISNDPENDSSNMWAISGIVEGLGPWNFPTINNDHAVRTACLWFIYAGKKVWAKVREGQLFRDNHPSDKEQPAYDLERWADWKQKLSEWRSSCTDERTRSMIGDALEQIKRVELE